MDSSHPYLLQRGIDAATAREFGVGFYGGNGLLKGRIVIPIRNQHGELVAYAGRAVDGRTPKYLLPAGCRKGLEVFNLDRAAAAASGETVIVVEGYLDCLHQAGVPGVVALMGCALSTRQESMLVERFRRVVLMLDGDPAGRAAGRRLRARLSGTCEVALVELPDGAQPDQLPASAIRPLLGGVLPELRGGQNRREHDDGDTEELGPAVAGSKQQTRPASH